PPGGLRGGRELLPHAALAPAVHELVAQEPYSAVRRLEGLPEGAALLHGPGRRRVHRRVPPHPARSLLRPVPASGFRDRRAVERAAGYRSRLLIAARLGDVLVNRAGDQL